GVQRAAVAAAGLGEVLPQPVEALGPAVAELAPGPGLPVGRGLRVELRQLQRLVHREDADHQLGALQGAAELPGAVEGGHRRLRRGSALADELFDDEGVDQVVVRGPAGGRGEAHIGREGGERGHVLVDVGHAVDQHGHPRTGDRDRHRVPGPVLHLGQGRPGLV
ncbi:MAG: hypothetical protein ACK559_41450, partial [bacterium]